MRNAAVLITLTYISLSLIPTCCVKRTYEGYCTPHFKSFLEVATLLPVLTCCLYYALRTAYVTTQTTQSNYVPHAAQLLLYPHITRYRIVQTGDFNARVEQELNQL